MYSIELVILIEETHMYTMRMQIATVHVDDLQHVDLHVHVVLTIYITNNTYYKSAKNALVEIR